MDYSFLRLKRARRKFKLALQFYMVIKMPKSNLNVSACEVARNPSQLASTGSKAKKLLVPTVMAMGAVMAPEVFALDTAVATAIDTGLAGVQSDAVEVSGKVWGPLIAVTGITIVMGLFKRMAGKI